MKLALGEILGEKPRSEMEMEEDRGPLLFGVITDSGRKLMIREEDTRWMFADNHVYFQFDTKESDSMDNDGSISWEDVVPFQI